MAHNRVAREAIVYTYIVAIFSGLLVIANVLAVKPLPIAGTVVPAAVITYALTFVLTDIVNEIWGGKRAAQVVMAGMIVSLVVAGFVRLAMALPGAGDWEGDAAFREILGQNGRIVFASMVAYIASQLHDVWAFNMWRKLTGPKHLWLRNTASTIVSQLIDSSLFIGLAFYGIWGGLDALIPVILAQFGVKVVIAVLDTPVIYFGVWLTRRFVRGSDAVDVEFV